MGSGSLATSAGQGSASITANFNVTVPATAIDPTYGRRGYRYRFTGGSLGSNPPWQYVTAGAGPLSSNAFASGLLENTLHSFTIASGTWDFDTPDSTFSASDSWSGSITTATSPPPSPPAAPGVPTVTATPVAGQPETWDITVTGTGNRKRIVAIEDGVERQVASSTATSPLTYRYAKPAGKNAISARGEQWNYFNSWDGASTVVSATIPVTFGNIGWGFRL